uniref:NADH:quinone oxidoreductase/Mrp antiporter membrane subunit domain-containing protein n=1 Tax=Lactuca sativa TaxID=4236 RepID=A0A9R1X4L7_LACSA|nr:hypothetical protein LSAT_V11C600323930 [Lactuca sativa]
MIYGSTGATHFDQLAKILTGYEITGARSSGIFMGILSIAVGSLFKITAVPFRAAVGRTAAYRCCPPRRATRSVVLSHKISTPPACWPGESKFSSGQLSTQSSAKKHSRITQRTLLVCFLLARKERRATRGLYWRDPTVNSCPKEKPPGSPRTFSIVLYPRTSSLRAKQDRPCPFPFSIPPPSLLCSNRV